MQTSNSGAQSVTQMSKPTWPYRLWPLLHTIRTYGTRELLIDIPTGLTQAVLHIPQGMAYALLAGVEPIYGLYVSFIPPLIYAMFASTNHVSIGKWTATFSYVEFKSRGLYSPSVVFPFVQVHSLWSAFFAMRCSTNEDFFLKIPCIKRIRIRFLCPRFPHRMIRPSPFMLWPM